MPKIIDDLQMKILQEAKRQVFEKGYAGMTIRSIAQECGIAAGTIYGYYSSKEHLTACLVLNDWIPLEEEIGHMCKTSAQPMEVFRFIYTRIVQFITDYQPLFNEKSAQKIASPVFHSRHCELRQRLADMIRDICLEKAKMPTEFLPDFIAEVLLSWSSEQRSFEDISIVLSQLFKSD